MHPHVPPVPIPSHGAWYQPGTGTRFHLWAPQAAAVELEILDPVPRVVPLSRDEFGYATVLCPEAGPGARYGYRLHDGQGTHLFRPDPASFSQPEGVHGPSQVVDLTAFAWTDDAWTGIPLEQHVLYELHVGTFSREGTFAAIIPELDRLRDLGITAIELMPVAQFPGARNWGYDGVFPFAVQHSYGGAAGLQLLVNACHQRGLAVVLDVVYNHLGPEGNYLAAFAPYFTGRYHTPWGPAINFDGEDSDHVRGFFLANALHWMRHFHLDGLRLDAIHGIIDVSARPFLAELSETVEIEAGRLNRRFWLFAESDLNDVRVLRPRDQGGFGMPAQWSDDFHHALHVELTGEQEGYYLDFRGTPDLAVAFEDGFVYHGQYSPHRRRRHGNSSREFAPARLVVFAQNHDQVGNRARGDRLSTLVSEREALKLAAGVVVLSPSLPLLFMGEEYGETAPFPYFTSHGDPGLVDAVRHGRQQEFAAFRWMGEVPDPQSPDTFAQARLRPELRRLPWHQTLQEFYRTLLRWRQNSGPWNQPDRNEFEVTLESEGKLLRIHFLGEAGNQILLFHFGRQPIYPSIPFPHGTWRKQIDSADASWMGPGSRLASHIHADGESPAQFEMQPLSLAVYQQG